MSRGNECSSKLSSGPAKSFRCNLELLESDTLHNLRELSRDTSFASPTQRNLLAKPSVHLSIPASSPVSLRFSLENVTGHQAPLNLSLVYEEGYLPPGYCFELTNPSGEVTYLYPQYRKNLRLYSSTSVLMPLVMEHGESLYIESFLFEHPNDQRPRRSDYVPVFMDTGTYTIRVRVLREFPGGITPRSDASTPFHDESLCFISNSVTVEVTDPESWVAEIGFDTVTSVLYGSVDPDEVELPPNALDNVPPWLVQVFEHPESTHRPVPEFDGDHN